MSLAIDVVDKKGAVRALCDLAERFHSRGWSMGTSGNYSVVLGREPLRLLVTASGRDKGCLSEEDFVVVDESGAAVEKGALSPSAETLLHVALASQRPEVGAVLHTHSVWSTLLSDSRHAEGGLAIEGYEMLKGLAGVSTHQHREVIEAFDNTQDIPEFALRLRARLAGAAHGLSHGFLIRRHGLYTWGRDLSEARRHVEILEFLLEVEGRRLGVERGA